jgi:hypothetical protein
VPSVEITKGGMFAHIEESSLVAVREALVEAAPLLYAAVVDEAPKDTGNLASQIFLDEPQPYGRIGYSIRVRVPDALKKQFESIVYGHEEFDITPANGQALAFDWGAGPENQYSRDGRKLFKKVTIPRKTANNFPRRALNKVVKGVLGLIGFRFVVRVKQ